MHFGKKIPLYFSIFSFACVLWAHNLQKIPNPEELNIIPVYGGYLLEIQQHKPKSEVVFFKKLEHLMQFSRQFQEYSLQHPAATHKNVQDLKITKNLHHFQISFLVPPSKKVVKLEIYQEQDVKLLLTALSRGAYTRSVYGPAISFYHFQN